MAGAKSSSHVPKFGNWDTDDVPYTICFDNARELQAAGVTFDPNDPATYPPVAAAANHKSIPPDRRGRHPSAAHDGGDHQRRPRQHPNRDRRAIETSGSEKLSSERSGSGYALLKEPKQSGRKKKNSNDNNEVDGISRFRPTVAGHGGNPNPNPNSRVRRNNEGEMMASVPKFGSWDARDPRSGDGYTAIFNKVKMEKQIAGSNAQEVPPLTNQTNKPISHTTAPESTSFASKICCCLCPK